MSIILIYFDPPLIQEIYKFANEGENHTNNVKQLEEMKKAMANAPPEAAKLKAALEKFTIPAAGEEWNPAIRCCHQMLPDPRGSQGLYDATL